MNRRKFLGLIAGAVVAPSLPAKRSSFFHQTLCSKAALRYAARSSTTRG